MNAVDQQDRAASDGCCGVPARGRGHFTTLPRRTAGATAVIRPTAPQRVLRGRWARSVKTSPPYSALGVLRGLTGLLQAGLLALHRAGVAGEETGLLQLRTVGLGVDLVERAGHAEAQRAGLTGDAAAGDDGDDVEAAFEVEQHERGLHQLLVEPVGEVVVQGATVDLPLPGARDEPDPGDRFLAASQSMARGGAADAAALGRSLGLGRVATGNVLVDLGSGLSHSSPR